MDTSIDYVLRAIIPLIIIYLVVVGAIGFIALALHVYRQKKDGGNEA